MEDLLLGVRTILGFNVTVKNVNKKLSRRYQELAKKKEKLNNVLKEGAVRLSELWVDILDNEATLEAVNISGTYNSLSKLKVLGDEWSKDQQKSFKSLIVKLAEKGREIYEQFNSQHIANTLNALSKWDVLDSDVWDGKVTDATVTIEEQISKVELFKALIYKLVEQGIQSSTQFNSQDIANTLNALSKWDVLDNQEFEDSKDKFKTLIVKLIAQGNTISTQFNSQAIASTFNALSKWNVLNSTIWTGKVQIKKGKEVTEVNKVQLFKDFIVNLAEQGIQSSTQFNSQHIASTLNALSKWDVLNSDVWDGKVTIDDQQVGEVEQFKTLIYKLVEQGIQSSTQFNSQAIANTLNALSKWDVLNTEIQQGSTEKCKTLIYKLVQQGNTIKSKDFNSQDIASTLNALSKWDVLNTEIQQGSKEKCKTLIYKLVQQGNTIKSKDFNSQDIANTLNALSKWDVLNSDVWDGKVTIDDQQVGEVEQFKTLIYKLVEQGIQSSTQFNSQAIANTLNALPKWDVLNTEIQQGSKEKCKTLIYKLVEQGIQSSTQFNSQAIANTLNALSKWDVLNTEIQQGSKEKCKNLFIIF